VHVMASGRAIMLRVTLDCIADGKPISIMESGAILMYLAEKKGDGKFLSHDPRLKWETIQWLFFQMGGIGPMFGQVYYMSCLNILALSIGQDRELCINFYASRADFLTTLRSRLDITCSYYFWSNLFNVNGESWHALDN
jgi:hypothetical protein